MAFSVDDPPGAPAANIPAWAGSTASRVLGPLFVACLIEKSALASCRLAWRSKEPSWRRIGKRFVPDLAARRCPSTRSELLPTWRQKPTAR